MNEALALCRSAFVEFFTKRLWAAWATNEQANKQASKQTCYVLFSKSQKQKSLVFDIRILALPQEPAKEAQWPPKVATSANATCTAEVALQVPLANAVLGAHRPHIARAIGIRRYPDVAAIIQHLHGGELLGPAVATM